MRTFLICLALFAITPAIFAQDTVFHHDLSVSLDPASGQLEVSDTITLPEAMEWAADKLGLDPKKRPTKFSNLTIAQLAELAAEID